MDTNKHEFRPKDPGNLLRLRVNPNPSVTRVKERPGFPSEISAFPLPLCAFESCFKPLTNNS